MCILAPGSGSVLQLILCVHLPNTRASESLLNPLLNCTFKQTSGLIQAAVREQHTESLPLEH